jgi:hypothetical protein
MARRTVRRKPRAKAGPGKRSTAPRKRVRKMARAKAKRRAAARTTSKRAPAVKTVAPKAALKQTRPSAALAAAEPNGAISASHEPLKSPSFQEPGRPVQQAPSEGAHSIEADEELDLEDDEESM